MPSDKKFVSYIAEQARHAGIITTKSMMGEYLIYCDGIYVALVSDNLVFVKPSPEGKAWIGEVVERPPYPGAKPCFYIESRFEDEKWFSELIQITTVALSGKKKKK